MCRPSSTVQKHTGRSMTTARCTSGWRGQKLNPHCVSALQGKLLTPDKEEKRPHPRPPFCFSLSSFFISPFYHKCNPSPPLGTIKGETRATSKGGLIETDLTDQALKRTHTPPKKLGICSLSRKLITPITSTLVQGNTSSSRIHQT
jgi:hypothetical protein